MGTWLDEQFWLSSKVHELGPIGIAVWNCLIQGKHAAAINLPGLYSISHEDVFWQLGGDLMGPELKREVENGFWLIVGKGMAVYDAPSRQVRIPNVWKYAATPNTNQISGWKAAFLKAPKSDFKYQHLPALRKLAERCVKGNGAQMFDARFGLLVPGDARTNRLGDHWKPGEPLPTGVKRWLDPTDQDLPEKNIDDLFFSKRDLRSEDLNLNGTLTPTLTLTLNGGSRRVLEGFSKGFEGGVDDNEGSGGYDDTQEGFENCSGTIPEGFENGSRMVREGFQEPAVGADDDRRAPRSGSPSSADRPVPGQSGVAPRREPASRSPVDPSTPLGVGGGDLSERVGGGGWADVVELPVPDGRPGSRKRQ